MSQLRDAVDAVVMAHAKLAIAARQANAAALYEAATRGFREWQFHLIEMDADDQGEVSETCSI